VEHQFLESYKERRGFKGGIVFYFIFIFFIKLNFLLIPLVSAFRFSASVKWKLHPCKIRWKFKFKHISSYFIKQIQ
jgi:hypothetical protein